MSANRYLVTALFALAGVMLGSALVNFLVDPYLVFGRPRVAGFNQAKPAAESREGLMKAYEAQRHNPRTVVLGSSRADIGLNPASASWPPQWGPVYNLSLAGADLGQNLRYLKHLVRAHAGRSALEHVVLGLDFESFLARPKQAGTGADAGPRELEIQSRLDAMAAVSVASQQRAWQDKAESLFTLDALLDSGLAVLASQSATPGVDIDADGQFSDGQLRKWTQTDGVAQLFKQKNLDMLRGFKPPRRSLDPGDGSLMRGQSQVAGLLELARQHRLKLVLLIQPSHVSRLEMLDAMGYWAEFELWKRALTTIADAARASGVNVTLWDFSGYEPENLEQLPAKEQAHTPLQWYWDPVHYRPALGDRLLAMVTAEGGAPPPGMLTAATVDARLQQVHRDRAAYRERNQADANQWRMLVCPGPSCAKPAAP